MLGTKSIGKLILRLSIFWGGKKERYLVAQSFEKVFFEDQYYLNPNANLQDFSTITKIPLGTLKQYIINKYRVSFEGLCNSYRIKRMVEKLENPLSDTVTIDALLRGCGFETEQDFYKGLNRNKQG